MFAVLGGYAVAEFLTGVDPFYNWFIGLILPNQRVSPFLTLGGFMVIGGFVTRHKLEKRYSTEVYEHMMDVLYDTPVSDLIDELLGHMTMDELDQWAKSIEDDSLWMNT